MKKDITLKSDKLELTVLPEVGACLTSLVYKKKDGKTFKVLRDAEEKHIAKHGALASSSFAMLPYASYIKDGAFVYWGIRRKVASTHPAVGAAVHGDGWRNAWQVKSSSSGKVEMVYKHKALGKGKNFPYDYTATQIIEVKGATMKVTLEIKNNTDLPMPCGLGMHPFFTRTKDVWIKCRNRTVWWHKPFPAITKPYKSPKDWSFEEGAELGDMAFDTCFGGFDGAAEIQYRKDKVGVKINAYDDFSHVVIYSPDKENFFCLEPMTNATDAFNLAAKGIMGTGIKTLEPGDTLSGTIEVSVEDLA